MDKHTEQHLDKLAEKVLKTPNLESPSVDFTTNIMNSINALPLSKSINYKPLISKYGWLAIIIVLISLSTYIMLNSTGDSTWLKRLDLSSLSNTKFTEVVSGFTISKTLIYAIGLLGIMLFIQIPILKQYHNKQFKV
ncbi:hypothetical protein RM697_11515 [Ichthyenterobacterium sp. W332]|uniref:Uncharacterized protein n=1 Tax=Microcosmobacter mediterraneus TaxID=3075607 RepID=A0ABU2YM99_9FLAO|nr:hypothetical protein [Ichthyenterobacterium sp. W332]MDT0559283.1 hypothetical protein [Ichthyenterobacterium sp. W332]